MSRSDRLDKNLNRPRTRITVAVYAAATIAVVLAAVVTGMLLSRATNGVREPTSLLVPQAPAAFLNSLEIPEFNLVDQDAQPVDRSIFDDRHSVLAFTFTNCPTVCPIMHSHLLRVQHELAPANVQIVTISVDPEHDSPEVFRQYMERLQIDTGFWTMLTGERPVIESIARALKLGYTVDPSTTIPLKDGSGTMANIDHSSKLVLVGPDRRIVDLASGLAWEDVQRLVRLAEQRGAPDP